MFSSDFVLRQMKIDLHDLTSDVTAMAACCYCYHGGRTSVERGNYRLGLKTEAGLHLKLSRTLSVIFFSLCRKVHWAVGDLHRFLSVIVQGDSHWVLVSSSSCECDITSAPSSVQMSAQMSTLPDHALCDL